MNVSVVAVILLLLSGDYTIIILTCKYSDPSSREKLDSSRRHDRSIILKKNDDVVLFDWIDCCWKRLREAGRYSKVV